MHPLTAAERDVVGRMDELLGRLGAKVGIDRPTAEKAVGIILAFLRKEGPSDKVQTLIAGMPGAEAWLRAHPDNAAGAGGIMGAGMSMMAAGLSMGQVQGVVREFIHFAREKSGEAAVGGVVAAIPGLSQFI